MKNDKKIFTPQELWYGGFYELAIELGDAGDDQKIACALAEVWSQPRIAGPFEKCDIEPYEQKPTRILLEPRHYYGTIECVPLHPVCCGTCMIQEDAESEGSSWLILYIPYEALHRIIGYSEGSPIVNETFVPVIDMFRAIALAVYRRCGFKLALIGHEISGDFYADTLTTHDIPCSYCGFLLPNVHPVTQEVQGDESDPPLVWYKPQLSEESHG